MSSGNQKLSFGSLTGQGIGRTTVTHHATPKSKASSASSYPTSWLTNSDFPSKRGYAQLFPSSGVKRPITSVVGGQTFPCPAKKAIVNNPNAVQEPHKVHTINFDHEFGSDCAMLIGCFNSFEQSRSVNQPLQTLCVNSSVATPSKNSNNTLPPSNTTPKASSAVLSFKTTASALKVQQRESVIKRIKETAAAEASKADQKRCREKRRLEAKAGSAAATASARAALLKRKESKRKDRKIFKAAVLSQSQRAVVSAIEAGESVFFTGSAGTGPLEFC
mmetsp:Transcript_5962/g.11346  ORF Transcript_5962/g.11346 Transcript_5962/m.11346 type:complete len:276 (+) Transcript_5962:22-849(+)